jgi:hypothetical protein
MVPANLARGWREAMEIRDAFRLMAIEVLMLDLLSHRYLSCDDPVETAKRHRAHMRSVLRHAELPFLGNAETADAARRGIADAIDALIEMASQNLGEKQ